MTTRLIVKQGPELIADVPDYTGPVPVVGTHLFHPPYTGDGPDKWDGGTAGCVKLVQMSVYGRPLGEEKHFVGREVNVIEVHI